MSFAAPQLLWGLLLVPVAVAFYLWAQRRRSRYAVRFTNLDLLANLAPRRPAWRRHLPPALYLVAIAALLLGLARPSLTVPTPREDATVLLAIDVSGSMNAEDVSPTRLHAARDAAKSFLDQLPEGIRVGLVSFSSQPVTLVEPTSDRARVRDAVDGLVARGGTAMGDAIVRVVELAEPIQAGGQRTPSGSPRPPASGGTSPDSGTTAPDRSSPPTPPGTGPATGGSQPLVAAILLSDGANSVGQGQPLDAAQQAAARGVPVYTIALGTPEGQVQVRNERGQLVVLNVPPDRETLAQIAEITGGIAFDAPTAEDLRAVYENLQSRIGFVHEEQEVTALFAAAALAFVVASGALAALWFGRLP